MPESIKHRTDYLDTVRSLILLHPAGYRDGQPMIPTFHRPGEELSEDYSGGSLHLAPLSQRETLYTLLSKVHVSLKTVEAIIAFPDDSQALTASLLMRPEVMQTGSGLSLKMYQVLHALNPDLAFGCCFAGLFSSACQSNFEFYFDLLIEEAPELIGYFIEAALTQDSAPQRDYLLEEIEKHQLINSYLERQISLVSDLDAIRQDPLVQVTQRRGALGELLPQQATMLAEKIRKAISESWAREEALPGSSPRETALSSKTTDLSLALALTLGSPDQPEGIAALKDLFKREHLWGLTAQVILVSPQFSEHVRLTALKGVYSHAQTIGIELAKLITASTTGKLQSEAQKISLLG